MHRSMSWFFHFTNQTPALRQALHCLVERLQGQDLGNWMAKIISWQKRCTCKLGIECCYRVWTLQTLYSNTLFLTQLGGCVWWGCWCVWWGFCCVCVCSGVVVVGSWKIRIPSLFNGTGRVYLIVPDFFLLNLGHGPCKCDRLQMW